MGWAENRGTIAGYGQNRGAIAGYGQHNIGAEG